MLLILILTLFVLFFLGVPIFLSLAASSFIYLIFFSGVEPMVGLQRMFSGLDVFAIMAMPFFILAAYAMDVGGLSNRILNWAQNMVGHFPGGAALTTQLGGMFFGSLSGSSPATVAAISKIVYPELKRQNYPKAFSSGLIVQSGSIALLIPPSIALIIFGISTNTSVGSLFMAGLGAGLAFGLIILLYVLIYSLKNKLPTQQRASIGDLWSSTKKASWALLVPVIVLGGIYSGIFTPTEAAAISAFYAIFVGMIVYQEITWEKLFLLCRDAAITSAQMMMLVASASVFAWVLTTLQAPQILSSFIMDNFTSIWSFLIALNIFLLIVGMFMDATTAILVIAPLVFSTGVTLGVDPIHMGTIMVANLAIGMFTPPFGLNIFIASSVTGEVITEMIPGIMMFFLVALVGLAIITFIPAISLFLPNLLY